jgi:acetyl-CoA carboxylase biotin carboxylase subunit
VRVARGEALGYAQEDIAPRGASIEFRVYAEDPDRGYLPDAGTVRRLELPAGPGVRTDFGVRAGGTVPVYYDPLVGKIIVWAPTRPEAVARARRALAECVLEGVRTTLPLHRWLLRQEPFVSGDYDTAYLTHAFRRAERAQQDDSLLDDAALAAVFARMDGAGFRRPMTESGASGALGAPGGPGAAGAVKPSRWRAALPGLRSGGAGGRR